MPDAKGHLVERVRIIFVRLQLDSLFYLVGKDLSNYIKLQGIGRNYDEKVPKVENVRF